ncbi:MAG: membrane protein insertase YidC, partial [Acidobacteriota bacterium]
MRSQEDAEIERRLLIAILLSIAILFGTPYLYQRFFPSPPEEAATQQTAPENTPTPRATRPPRVAEAEPPAAPAAEGTPATQVNVRFVTAENDALILRFSSRGGVLVGAKLKKYTGRNQEPLELVPQILPADFPRPLSLTSSNRRLEARLGDAVYEIAGTTANHLTGPADLTFEYRADGLQVRKTISVPKEGYDLKVSVEATENGEPLPLGVVLGTGIGEIESRAETDFSNPEVAYYQDGSVERHTVSNLEKAAVTVPGSVPWVALDGKYFAFIMVAPEEMDELQMQAMAWKQPPVEGEKEGETLNFAQATADLMTPSSFGFFVGPKDHKILATIEPTLPSLIDYGWFGVLVKPLLAALNWVHGYVHNYGWAIIILTFLINLALFPVRYKQITSMQKMSELQPKLRSIQDRYKRMKRDDPRKQQMNAEVMALYKENGVNPLGGCLPLVIQMPILFAFYRMLAASIELRGAPFIFWIHDLSQYDPYYITPIVMGLTMVGQQKMTPTAGDPTQRKMMMFLPVVFTFFFLHVSSGLAIY